MGSDRARSTYDRAKQYRRVVPQQGRVVLEADLNEASEIASEEARQQVLDIVGAYGVPRDPKTQGPGTGYALRRDQAGEIQIGPGPIYVGGLRVEQEDPELTYGSQREGLEEPPIERALPRSEEGHPHGVAFLYLREQEVSATEDTALLDVALGGPDTAQRARLIRKVVLARASSPQPGAVSEVTDHLHRSGYVFDPADMRLHRTIRLHVEHRAIDEADEGDHADESRHHLPRRSYLGAENQLVRIQISSTKDKLLWGYDNASALYRVDPVDGVKGKLLLRSAPVDEHHEPRKGQVVEVLEATASLHDGGAIAAASGDVRRLTVAYDPDEQSVVLDAALPEGWLKKELFLRVWENEHSFTPDEPVILIDSHARPIGIDVTLSHVRPTGAVLEPEGEWGRSVPGDFWSFAVRPMEPTRIDPPRYAKPQPPEGPREWMCPLALVDFAKGSIQDLRPTFENLVRVDQRTENQAGGERGVRGASRVVTVTEEELTGSRNLTTIIEEHVAELKKGIRITLLLEPGTYNLRAPLRLGAQHSGLTIEGRGARFTGVFREGAGDHLFIDGLVVAIDAQDVTLRGLDFDLKWVPFQPGWLNLKEVEERHPHARKLTTLRSAIGIRAVNCNGLTVEDCRFSFADADGHHAFGVAIFAGGENRRLRVEDNRFEAHAAAGPADGTADAAFSHLVFGYLLAPSVAVSDWSVESGLVAKKGKILRSFVSDAVFRANVFSGMAAAVLILAHVGTVRFERNRVRDSYGGFWLFSMGTVPLWGWSADGRALGHEGLTPVLFEILGVLQDPVIQLGIALAQWVRSPMAAATADVVADHSALGALRARLLDPLNVRAQTWLGQRLFRTESIQVEEVQTEGGLSLTAIAIASSAVAVAAEEPQDIVGPFSLHLADNDIIVRRRGEERSGAGIILWTTDTDPEATVILSANQIRNSSLAHPALMMLTVAQAVVTGNVVINEARADAFAPGWLARTFPLLAAARAATSRHPHTRLGAIILPHHGPEMGESFDPIAVTGNVLGGENSLPARPGKLPAWATYNSSV